MNNIEALEKYALSLECSAERGVSMKNYTSFKVGGPAELFLSPEDSGQTAKLVRFCEKEDIPVFVLGKGSNVLVSDKGIKGAVIFTGKQCGITLTDENTVRAQSGASLAQLCARKLAFGSRVCLWHTRNRRRRGVHERRSLRRRDEGCAHKQRICFV